MNLFPGAVGYLAIFRRHVGRRIYVIFGLTVLGTFMEGIGIALLVPLLAVLDTGLGDADSSVPGALRAMLEFLGLSGSLHGILALIGGVFLIKAIIVFTNSAYSGWVQAQLLRELKAKMFDAYSRMSYQYYSSRDTGHFINVINGQVGSLYGTFKIYIGFLSVAIRAVIYLSIALWLAWQFAVMAIVIGGLVVLCFQRLNVYVRQLSIKVARETSHLNKLLVQALQSFKYLVSTQQIDPLRSGVVASIRRMTGYRLRSAIWASVTSSITEPLTIFLLIGIIIVQISVLGQPLAPILVAIFLFNRALSAILGLQKGWQTIMSNIGSVEMVEEEFEALERHREPNGTVAVGPLAREVRFEGVSFSYEPEKGDVLRDVDLTIPARTTVAFVGESGAGKSTLVDMLTLLLKPRSGEVYIDGVPGSEIEVTSWRRQIGYVSQETVVFDDTIAGNIALQPIDRKTDPDAWERVLVAARRAHISRFVERLPQKYDTVVGDRGIRLSGGQRQRLFIARELFKEPNLLILDEATSALDSESEGIIQRSIDGLKGSMTVVMIAHRLSTIRNVDFVYVLDGGKVVEQGPYEALMGREASRFREMIELQRL